MLTKGHERCLQESQVFQILFYYFKFKFIPSPDFAQLLFSTTIQEAEDFK